MYHADSIHFTHDLDGIHESQCMGDSWDWSDFDFSVVFVSGKDIGLYMVSTADGADGFAGNQGGGCESNHRYGSPGERGIFCGGVDLSVRGQEIPVTLGRMKVERLRRK